MKENWTPERLEKVCIALCIAARELEEIRERELEEQQTKDEISTHNSQEIASESVPDDDEEEHKKPRKSRKVRKQKTT